MISVAILLASLVSTHAIGNDNKTILQGNGQTVLVMRSHQTSVGLGNNFMIAAGIH
jgi:hypothetical protein